MKVPSWSVPGIVQEVRELKMKNGGEIWAYAVKVVAMGGTYECTTRDKALAAKCTAGAEVVARGSFELFNGSLRLSLVGVDVAAVASPAPLKAAV